MIKYSQLAIEANKKGKDTMIEVILQHRNAFLLLAKNKLDEAISLLKDNLKLLNRAETFGNSEYQRIFWRENELLGLAEIYYRKHNYLLATQYLNEIKNFGELDEKITDASSIRKWRLLVLSYIKLNEKDSAIKYIETFFSRSKTTLTALSPEKFNELTIEYKTEKKQRQIEQLQQQYELQQLQASKERTLNMAFITIFCLLLIGGYFIIKNIHQKRKVEIELARQEAINAEQLHKQKELELRNKITRDLHDDIGATLSSVKAYSEILQTNPDNLLMNDLIRQNADEMIQQIEVIAWATNPQHDNLKSLTNAMLKFARPISYARDIELLFKKDGLDENLNIPGDIRQNIFLFFKEAINNMIKYANASLCSISVFVKDQNFYIEVRDNGIGYDEVIKG